MNYPDSIYRKFEIIEKELCGETVYGLIEHKTILFGLIKYKKQHFLHLNTFDDGIVSITSRFDILDKQKWIKKKSGVQRAINDCHRMTEYYFEKWIMKK